MATPDLSALLTTAGIDLEAALALYYPGTPGVDGRNLKERNLTAYFTKALFAENFTVYHEAILSAAEPRKALDLLALSPDRTFLIKAEAKRLIAKGSLDSVRSDVGKLKVFEPLPEHEKQLPKDSYSVLLFSCWCVKEDRFPEKWKGEHLPGYKSAWSGFIDELRGDGYILDGRLLMTEHEEGRKDQNLWFLWAFKHDAQQTGV